MNWLIKLRDFIKDRFKQPTKLSSRREFSEGSIAEFWCSASNVGFFVVGLYFGDITLLLAGAFSLISHSVPSQGVHDLDMLGVLLIGIKVMLFLPIIIANPAVLAIGALAIAVNMLDTFITRRYPEIVGPWIHVLWHLTAAAAIFVLNTVALGIPLTLSAISLTPMIAAVVIASTIIAASIYFIPKITPDWCTPSHQKRGEEAPRIDTPQQATPKLKIEVVPKQENKTPWTLTQRQSRTNSSEQQVATRATLKI